MTDQNEKSVYIYNPEQANFYVSKGIMMKATGVHPTTKRVWYKFGFDETTEVYSQWCTRNR